jgi:putative oxidoreductase
MMETTNWNWKTFALLLARLIFALVFLMAVTFKIMSVSGTASFIAAAGFPIPTVLTFAAIILEICIVLSLLTGAYFREFALLAAVYVIFLGFAFHGPSHWAASQAEFGFFIDHFTFLAGLLIAAVHGPGRVLAINRSLFN